MKNSKVNLLLQLREDILSDLTTIMSVLKDNFPETYDSAYQHWIPQIITALYNDTKWLPRGQLSFQDTIDKINDNNDFGSGVSKFIN